MYKVFFKDRIIFFESNFSEVFKSNTGLFYRYRSKMELNSIISAYYDLTKIHRLYLFHNDLDFLWEEFKSVFRYIPAAGGILKNQNDEYLVIKRNGIWDLPKGKAEKGESMVETAVREVSEECGLDNIIAGDELTTTYHTYKIDDQLVLKETKWFRMSIEHKATPSPQTKEGITEVKWVKENGFGFMKNNTYGSVLDVLEAEGIGN